MNDQNWYVKNEEQPLEDYGKRPEKRSIEERLEKGIVIVDKPFGPSSNQVTAWIKDQLNIKKAGHFGTLDPNATGILPIGLNQGTRIQEIISGSSKEYIFEVEIEEEVEKDILEKAFSKFQGVNQQVPPEKSAVKREKRERKVHEIELLEKEKTKFLGRVKCESGFYVRVLVEDIGEEIKVETELNELRRTKQSHINEEDLCNIQDIVDEYHFWKNDKPHKLEDIIRPIEYAVKDLRKVVLKNSAVNAVANGADLGASGIAKLQGGIDEGEKIALMTLKGELVAIAEAKIDSEQMYDGIETAAELESVHLDPDTYPRRWKQN